MKKFGKFRYLGSDDMPDNFGRMTESEASPALRKFLYENNQSCYRCKNKKICPYNESHGDEQWKTRK